MMNVCSSTIYLDLLFYVVLLNRIYVDSAIESLIKHDDDRGN